MRYSAFVSLDGESAKRRVSRRTGAALVASPARASHLSFRSPRNRHSRLLASCARPFVSASSRSSGGVNRRWLLPILLRLTGLRARIYYGCVAEVAAEPRSVPVTVVHERRQGPILLRSMSSNANAEEAVMPRSVPVAVAHELLTAGHRYLDVRTLKEFIGGHAVGAVNIPYMLESVSGRSKNTSFIQEVSSIFKKDDYLIIGCLSGKRSLVAASELSNAGFTGITDVAGGYSAWVANGLPTEQK